jgi:hypothetical protein
MVQILKNKEILWPFRNGGMRLQESKALHGLMSRNNTLLAVGLCTARSSLTLDGPLLLVII